MKLTFATVLKRILTTLSQKWPQYLLEIIVITLGILGAYLLDNWNDNRLENKVETRYLKSLHQDLVKDVESLTFMQSIREKASKSALKLLKTKSIGGSFDEQLQFEKDLVDVLFWYEFTPNDNTFKELTSSGNLSIIDNEKIKSGLLNLEALNNEIVLSRNHMKREFDIYLYDEFVHFDEFPLLDYDHIVKTREYNWVDDADPLTLKKISEESNLLIAHQTIRNGFKLAILNNAYLVYLYLKMLVQNKALQNEIKDELSAGR
ncbi:MAG: hypothetical protein ACJA2C_002723 [Marinoscillum sp.]